MIRTLVALVVALVMGGNAWGDEQAHAAEPSVAPQIDLETTEDYAEQVNCISLRHIRSTKVLDYRRMLFYMRDKTIYLNQFQSSCQLLTDRRMTSFQTALDGFLCKMDRLEVLNDLMIPSYAPGGRAGYEMLSWCYVGAFEPVSAAQAEFLRTEGTTSGRSITDAIEADEATRASPP